MICLVLGRRSKDLGISLVWIETAISTMSELLVLVSFGSPEANARGALRVQMEDLK